MNCIQGLKIMLGAIMLFSNASSMAQNKKVENKLIIGKWATVEDEKSELIFEKKNVYQLYGKDTGAKYSYEILDSSNSTVVRIPIVRFIRFSDNDYDTSYFALQGLSHSLLSLFDMTHTKQTWLLKKKNRH